jgi:hypothetical protein
MGLSGLSTQARVSPATPTSVLADATAAPSETLGPTQTKPRRFQWQADVSGPGTSSVGLVALDGCAPDPKPVQL